MKKDEPTPTPKIQTKVRIELKFDMGTSKLAMASGSSTVVLYGVLRRAALYKAKEIPETAPGAQRRVNIEYDLADDTCHIETDCSPVILAGVIAIAESAIGQQQLLQRIQGSAAREKIMAPEAPAGHMRLGDIPLGRGGRGN